MSEVRNSVKTCAAPIHEARLLRSSDYECGLGFLLLRNRSESMFVADLNFDTTAPKVCLRPYRQIAKHVWSPRDSLDGGWT